MVDDSLFPLPSQARQPLVTFALFAYNQEKYICDAIRGAFSQNYEPLEIILSDDYSTDKTFQLMQEMVMYYQGPHKVRLRRNTQNMGLAMHVNTVFRESNGDFIVIAAGDDISLPMRTSISVEYFLKEPKASAVLLSANIIDEKNIIIGELLTHKKKSIEVVQTLTDLLEWRHATFGATRAISRNSIASFGPLNESCPTEDTPLLLRSLLSGSNILSRRKAILYRRHENNLSNIKSLKKLNIDAISAQYRHDICTAVKLSKITRDIESQLMVWVNVNQRIRLIRLKLGSNEVLDLKDFIFAIRSSAMKFKEKFHLVLICLIMVLGQFK